MYGMEYLINFFFFSLLSSFFFFSLTSELWRHTEGGNSSLKEWTLILALLSSTLECDQYVYYDEGLTTWKQDNRR